MIRIAGISFLAALLLVSVPLLAGPQDGVREKLAELQELLDRLEAEEGGEGYVFEPSRTSVRVFEVADLTVRLTDYRHPNLLLRPAGSEVSEDAPLFGRSDEGEMFFLGVEELMDLIVTNVRPDFWESGAGRLDYAGPFALLAVAPPAVLKEIGVFLADIRKSVGRLVSVEVHVVPLEPGAARPPARMSRDEGRRLIEGAERVVSARITGFNGQRVSFFRGRQRAFVQDYDVEVAQNSNIGDPIVGVMQSGLAFDVRPAARGEDLVVLEIMGQVSVADGKLRTVATTSGPAQAPRQGHAEFAASLTVASGSYATISAGSRHAVLVSARSERLAAGGGR